MLVGVIDVVTDTDPVTVPDNVADNDNELVRLNEFVGDPLAVSVADSAWLMLLVRLRDEDVV